MTDSERMSQDFPPESDDDPRMRRLLAAYAPALLQHLRERLDGLLSDDLAAQVTPAICAAARDYRSLDADTPEPPLALRRSVSENLTIFCLRTGLTGPALVLLLEYAPHIKQALKRGKHGQYLSEEDLEDLARDTMVRAVERGAQYQPELSSLGRWLNVLAHYAMLDLIRDRSVLSAAGRDRIAAEQLQELGDGAPEFDEQMRERIREAIGKLSPGLALYIQRSFLEGWSDTEIQHALNARPGTLRVWKTRALQKLRAILGSSLGLVLVIMIVTFGPVVAQPLTSMLGPGPIAKAPGQTPTATVAPSPIARMAEPLSLSTASATTTPPSASPTLAPPSVAPASPVPSVTRAESVAAPSATASLAASPTVAATVTPLTLPSPLATLPSSAGALPPTATPRLELQLPATPIRAPAQMPEESPTAPEEAAEPTATPEPETTASPTATATASATPTATATASATPTATATASATPSPTATATASATPSPTATTTATASATPSPTATTTATASATPSLTATATASATPTPEVCQGVGETVVISGAEMGLRAEQTIVIPESRWSTVQVVGRFAGDARTLPDLVRFRFADGTEIVRHAPSLVNDHGYIFEAPGRPGSVSVYVREPRGAATAGGIVVTAGSAAHEGVCGVRVSPFRTVYNELTIIDLLLPRTLEQRGDLRVRGVFIAVQDEQPVIFGAEGGGVVAHVQTAPNAGSILIIEEVMLPDVPPGTDRVRIWFASPRSDSAAGIFVSASVAYPCPSAGPFSGTSSSKPASAVLAGAIPFFHVLRRRRTSHQAYTRCPRPLAGEAGSSTYPPGPANCVPRGA